MSNKNIINSYSWFDTKKIGRTTFTVLVEVEERFQNGDVVSYSSAKFAANNRCCGSIMRIDDGIHTRPQFLGNGEDMGQLFGLIA